MAFAYRSDIVSLRMIHPNTPTAASSPSNCSQTFSVARRPSDGGCSPVIGRATDQPHRIGLRFDPVSDANRAAIPARLNSGGFQTASAVDGGP